MKTVRVLDCTLRDGGYCNQWRFGFKNIKRIVSGLTEANIDIIECGFLTNKVAYNHDVTKFTTIEELKNVIPENKKGKLYVAMVNYGEYSAEDLPLCTGSSIDGIRVAFHKKDLVEAITLCEKIKQKGYKVFVQPMVSLGYTDKEFLELIERANAIQPYAFYIVDSFGVMKKKNLVRLFYMVEHNLDEAIYIGYHAHNNMQLAYANAQALVDIKTKRQLIIDSSVFGMGRGAGNLNTELFVEYLNDNEGTAYVMQPLLTIIDEILTGFYHQNYWGYSLPNYLSAKYNCHPNYASYLDEKKTLTVEAMDAIFSMMDDHKRINFDKNYIEELYVRFMEAGQAQETHLVELQQKVADKNVLIVAPGRSSIDEKEKVLECAQLDNVVTISINFDYKECETDFIFLSNLRRFRDLDPSKHYKSIVTSNISAVDVFLQTKYGALLNDVEAVQDNAGMMLVKFLIDLGVKKVYIAGMDGYSMDPALDYADQGMQFYTKKAVADAMNSGMCEVLKKYKEMIDIEFVTEPKHVNV